MDCKFKAADIIPLPPYWFQKIRKPDVLDPAAAVADKMLVLIPGAVIAVRRIAHPNAADQAVAR